VKIKILTYSSGILLVRRNIALSFIITSISPKVLALSLISLRKKPSMMQRLGCSNLSCIAAIVFQKYC